MAFVVKKFYCFLYHVNVNFSSCSGNLCKQIMIIFLKAGNLQSNLQLNYPILLACQFVLAVPNEGLERGTLWQTHLLRFV